MKIVRTLFGISLVCTIAGTIACGGPGAYDLCRAQCDGIERCGYRNDTQTQSCYNSCSANTATYNLQDDALEMSCKNASTIRHAQLSCYNTAPCGASSTEYLMTITKCGSTSSQSVTCQKP